MMGQSHWSSIASVYAEIPWGSRKALSGYNTRVVYLNPTPKPPYVLIWTVYLMVLRERGYFGGDPCARTTWKQFVALVVDPFCLQ